MYWYTIMKHTVIRLFFYNLKKCQDEYDEAI